MRYVYLLHDVLSGGIPISLQDLSSRQSSLLVHQFCFSSKILTVTKDRLQIKGYGNADLHYTGITVPIRKYFWIPVRVLVDLLNEKIYHSVR